MSDPVNPRDEGADTDEPNMVDWLERIHQSSRTSEGGASLSGDDSASGGQARDPEWRDGSEGVGYPQTIPDDTEQNDPRDAGQSEQVDNAGEPVDARDEWGTGNASDDTDGTDSVVAEDGIADEQPVEVTGQDTAPEDQDSTAEEAAVVVGTDTDDMDDTAPEDDSVDSGEVEPGNEEDLDGPLPEPIPLPRRSEPDEPSGFLDRDLYAEATEPGEDEAKPTRRKRHRKAAHKPEKPRKAPKAQRPEKTTGGKRPVMFGARGWTVVGVLALALCAGVGYTSTQIMSDDEPVSAQSADEVQTSVDAESPEVDQAIGPRAASEDSGSLPAPEDESIGGTCPAVEDADLPVMSTNQRDPRAAWVTYNAEMYGRNTDGIKAVLSEDSKLKDQNWSEVMDATPKDATFCLQMQPASGSTLRGQLEVITADGESTVYKQQADAVEVDGRWFIKDIKKDTRA